MLFENDPFRDIDTLLGRRGTRGTTGGGMSMPMDAYRRNDNVWVHIDLPGVTAESIEISVERQVLTVSAERGWPPEEGDRMYLSERAAGVFRRQVHLGEGLDSESIDADYQDGVLTLRIPVAAQAQPRRIAVRTKQDAIDVDSGDSGTDG